MRNYIIQSYFNDYKANEMKNASLTAVLIGLMATSSLAMAAVGVNHNGPQLNPYAQSNKQVVKTQVELEEVVPTTKLNTKEVNPLFKVPGEYQTNTGSGYSVRGDRN